MSFAYDMSNIYSNYPQPYGGLYGNYSAADVRNINLQIMQSIRAIAQRYAQSQTNFYAQQLSSYTSRQTAQMPVLKSGPTSLFTRQKSFAPKAHKAALHSKLRSPKPQDKNINADFLNRVKEIAKKIKCDYRDLLGVMNSESGLNPKARNKSSGAIGLIQFTGIAIKDLNQTYGLNLTKEKIAKMSAMEQLDLVEKYLTRAKSYRFRANDKLDSADLYAIVYRPAFAGKAVIARKSDGDTYRLNSGLDLDKDGVISREDLAQAVKRKHINVNLVA